MNDLVRQKVIDLVAQYGREVSSDAKRCEGLLRDVCGDQKREISVLVAAIRERVTIELTGSVGAVPREVLLKRLTDRLHNHQGIQPSLAFWAVTTWAIALGVIAAAEQVHENSTDSDHSPREAIPRSAQGDDAMPSADDRISERWCYANGVFYRRRRVPECPIDLANL